jgi:hypothetical protein
MNRPGEALDGELPSVADTVAFAGSNYQLSEARVPVEGISSRSRACSAFCLLGRDRFFDDQVVGSAFDNSLDRFVLVPVENEKPGRVVAHFRILSDWKHDDHHALDVSTFANERRRAGPFDSSVEVAQPVVELAKDGLSAKRVRSTQLLVGGDASLVPGHSVGRPAIKLVFLLGEEHDRAIDCSQHLFLRALLSVIPGLQGMRIRRHSHRSGCGSEWLNRDMRSCPRIEATAPNESPEDRP